MLNKIGHRRDWISKTVTGFEKSNNTMSPSMMVKVKDNKKTPRWVTILGEFCKDTTFHGIKHIAEQQRYVTRRLAWLLLFLGGTSIFLLQVSTSIAYYLSWPVSVDVKINYNDSIIFPAVTICNKNAFRASEAYKRGYYHLIGEIFGHQSTHNTSNAPSLDLEYLHRTLGHTQDDLIIGCVWSGGPCTASDFIPVMTDYGLCYTFNSGQNDMPLKLANQAGSNGGLRLELNIEQYEYMPGPNSGAGLIILVHHQKEVPLVQDYGLAIPSGSHGYVAVKTVEINNLKPHHGECNDSVQLDFFEDYAMYNCFTDCKEKYLLEKCGCRDFYMPSIGGTPKVCDMETYRSCMLPALEMFSDVKDSCYCPVPCHSLLYETSISFSSASNFDIDTLLDGDNSSKFKDKFVAAREVSQRVHKAIVDKDTQQIHKFEETVQEVTMFFEKEQDEFSTTLGSLKASLVSLQERMNFHLDRGLQAVEFILEHDFLRGWEVYHERAFHFVTQDFMGFPQTLNRTITSSAEKFDLWNNVTREWVYFPLRDQFSARLELIDRAETFLNETNLAYLTGEPLLTYELTLNRTYDMSYITLPLLQGFAVSQEKQYRTTMEGLGWMKLGVNILQEVGEEFVETGLFNVTKFLYGEDRFLAGGRRFNYRLYMYKTRVLDKPLEEIRRRISEFELVNRTIQNHYNTVERTLLQLTVLLDNIINATWGGLIELSINSSEYLSDVKQLKTNLSLFVTSSEIHHSVHTVGSFFDDFKIRVRTLYIDLTDLKLSFMTAWSWMLLENSTKEFYKLLNNHTGRFLLEDDNWKYSEIFAHLLRVDASSFNQWSKAEVVEKINGDFQDLNITEVLNGVEQQFEVYVNALDVGTHLGELDELIVETFEEFHDDMNAFIQGNEINSEFYRENVMTLDVFMQELSYQEITQQKAYGISQLVGDIGGSMGLFIGGSVLSIFEFLDIWVHHCFLPCDECK